MKTFGYVASAMVTCLLAIIAAKAGMDQFDAGWAGGCIAGLLAARAIQ